MKLTSPVFEDKGNVPKKYTCEGPNVSPPLEIQDVPEQAESLVLLVEDPDAPTGLWVHWLVYNIPPSVKRFDEGFIPAGAVEGVANGGTVGYEGPCPPDGTHRYVFRLIAVRKKLDLDPDKTDREKVLAAIDGHVIDEAILMGVYGGPAKRLVPL